MENKKEIFAGIIIIGNEILSGRTQDTNTSTLSIWLNSLGIKVQEVRVIPDIEETIIKTVNELRNKYNYIFRLIIRKYSEWQATHLLLTTPISQFYTGVDNFGKRSFSHPRLSVEKESYVWLGEFLIIRILITIGEHV